MPLIFTLALMGMLAGFDSPHGSMFWGLIGAVLGMIVFMSKQQREIDVIRARLEEISAAIDASRSAPDAQQVEETENPPQATEAQGVENREAKPDPLATQAHRAVASDKKAPSWSAVPKKAASETNKHPPSLSPVWRYVKAFFLTGNVVARVGVVILFFAVAFLLSYVASRAVISLELRLVGVVLGGMSLLMLGWRLRHRAGYGLVLQGGGVGIIYLTIFAAFQLYDLVAPLPALLLMLVLVALSTLLALLQDSRALAILGTTGGFLAPLMTATADGSHITLFSYYLLLNAGILAVAWYRAWRELNLLGFAFTFLISSYWGFLAYEPGLYASTQPFVVLFFLFYLAISVLFAHRQPPKLKGYVDGTLVFGLPAAVLALQAPLVNPFEYGLALSALFAATVYLGLARALWHYQRESMHLLIEAFLGLGVSFVILAVALAFDSTLTAAIWSLQGAALLWIGVRQQRVLARAAGGLLQLAAGVMFLSGIEVMVPDLPVLNARYLGGVLLSLAGLFCATYLYRHRKCLHAQETTLATVLMGWGLVWWLGSTTAESMRLIPDWALQRQALVLLFSATALGLYHFSRRLHWPAAGYPMASLLPALVLITLASVTELPGQTLVGLWGLVPWLLAGTVHLYILRIDKAHWPIPQTHLWHMTGLWLAVFIISWDLAWLVERYGPVGTDWSLVVWGLVPAVTLYLLSTARLTRWPLSEFAVTYRELAAWPIGVFLLIWVLATGVYPGQPAPLPYLPLLNPLELAQMGSLFAVLVWTRRFWRHQAVADQFSWLLPGALVATGFAVLNAVLARTVHHYADVPYAVTPLYDSILFQTGLSMLWSALALALMAYARLSKHRVAWKAGAAVLCLVIGKLFLIDLANAETLGRIVSFFGVGVTMLLIGYLAPLPPREASATQPQE